MSEAKQNNSGDDIASKTLNELMDELDQIVAWFSGDEVDIEQATKQFDRGVKLVEAIKHKLNDVKTKVNQIELRLKEYEEE